MKKGEVYWYGHKGYMYRVKLEAHVEGTEWETAEGEFCDESFLTTKQKAYDNCVGYLNEHKRVLDKRIEGLNIMMAAP